LALNNQKVCLIEKRECVGGGASGGNSGMIHTGFDCDAETLESVLVKRGHLLFNKWVKERANKCGFETPYKENGALMVAWDEV
jgi:glycerol-3-phosphate dehydrogenase